MREIGSPRAHAAHHRCKVHLGRHRHAGRELRFRRAVVATGGRPSVPPVEGLSDIPYLTSENIFEITEQPLSLLIIGGGSIGCEMAQAFALLGTTVTLIEAGPRLLPREDADASDIIARRLERDGMRIVMGATIMRVGRSGGGVMVQVTPGLAARRYGGVKNVDNAGDADSPNSAIGVNSANKADRAETAGYPYKVAVTEVVGDALLVATGRSPNVAGLNLECAGVRHGADGLDVDDRLRSSNRRIYAAGDVCSPFQFTHAADAMARIVIQNALFHGRRRASALVIPWSTYTFPEVAHVGLTPAEAAQAGGEPITVPLTDVDRAVIDGEADGFLRVHHQGGRIIAATLVAPRAGELIGYIASVMRRRGSLGDLSNEIFPYPTLADALRKAGDAYRRTRLTPRVRSMLRRYFALVRSM